MKKNIILFYILAFLQGIVFYSSIATLYRTSNGLSLYQMGIIEGCFSLCIILFEIPWGILCDKIGYKKTMIIANFFYLLSKIVFYKANSFMLFLYERIFLALAVSGLSGCDSSLLYLSCDQEERTAVFGKSSMFGVIGMVVASFAFTFIFHSNMHLAAFATIFPFAIQFILTFFITDYPTQNEEKVTLKQITHTIFNHKIILFVLFASVLLTETTHILTIFYNQLQYERVHIPLPYYGMIFIVLQLLGISSGLLGKLTTYFTKEKIAKTLFLLAAIASLGLYFSLDPISTIVLFMILSSIAALYFPILQTIQNDSVTTSRATTLSCYSLIMNLASMLINYTFGYVTNSSLTNAYLLSFTFCMIGYILFVIWHKKST